MIFSLENVKELVKNLTFLDFDYIVDISMVFFNACLKDKKMEKEALENKLDVYRTIWENTLIYMYTQNIPNIQVSCDMSVELTPFTLYMAEKNKTDIASALQITEDDKLFCNAYYNKFIAPYVSDDKITDKTNLTLRILIMPPFIELGRFYESAYDFHQQKMKNIIETVQNMKVEVIPYRCNIGLGFATHFIDQNMYEKYGKMDGLIQNPLFADVREQLEAIKNECEETKKLNQKSICPCCGETNDITVTKDDIFFAHLSLLHKEVQSKLVLHIMDDYKSSISDYIWNNFKNFNINDVKNPNCYILVEGATEEIAIPRMALKYGRPLQKKKIKVWNSKTKEKVLMDFEKFKSNNPDVCICVLLDGDAKKEIENISRMMKDKKNRYRIHSIENGTFEDILDKKLAIQALSSIYGEGSFSIADFDNSKSFLDVTNRKIHENPELAKFDKVEFINEYLKLTNEDNIPKLVKDIIDDCYTLVECIS